MSDVSFHDEIAGPSRRPVTSNRPFNISPAIKRAKGPTVPERRMASDRRIETNPKCAIEIVDSESLRAACRARADELQVSRALIDEIGGLPSGYTGKILGESQVRRISLMSLGPLLGVLCVRLVMVHDDRAFARLRSRLVKRSAANVRFRDQHERKSDFENISGPVTARMFGWPMSET
jgi:hypothetical protein